MASSPSNDLATAGKRLLGGVLRMWPTLILLAVVLGILVPLPTVLVDLLLSISLAGAVLLLVAALTVRRAAHFLSFPTLLMLITLYRLAINLSTTRLILTDANGGRVIDAFGGLVIRGDLVVGGVMFLVLTVVQYLVIARGAERVAEVAARFALDGMPGHQAAIDADLKAGTITAVEAGRRRSELGERSNFYGAMDGAVRYVKADAVASLSITALNLSAGLAIGMSRLGMSMGEAFDVYGRLTIGDGLLAQIPALLVSLAAGLLVSRVDRADDERRVRWLEPQMLLVPSVLLVVLAFVPGMPALAFATTAIGLVATSLFLALRQPVVLATPDGVRLVLRLHADDAGRLRNEGATLNGLRRRCGEALGLELPRFALRRDGPQPGKLQVLLDQRLLTTNTLDEPSEDQIVLGAFRGIMGRAPALVDLEDIDAQVETTRLAKPAVVREALRSIGTPDLLWLMRQLLRERLPAPEMSELLEVVASNPAFRDEHERRRWPAIARERLANFWVEPMLAGLSEVGTPSWVRPTPDLEDRLSQCTSFDGELVRLSVPERERRQLRAKFHTAGAPTLVLTTPAGRAPVAALLEGLSPHVPVVSTAELRAAGLEPMEVAGDSPAWIDVE